MRLPGRNSSASAHSVCSSLRMWPESEILTARVVWSVPARKRWSSGMNTSRASSRGFISRSVSVTRLSLGIDARRTVTR